MADQEVIEGEVEEVVHQLPAVRSATAIMARDEITVSEVVAQHDKIVSVMEAVMRDGIHYGRIPGISKPTLLKPGAEVIISALRLAPDYETEKLFSEDGHLTAISKCTLRHITTSLVIATGEGLCSSRESKYAYRNQKRSCPVCGNESIIKGKAEYGGGWICWKKEGGCGEKFGDGDVRIENQEVGKITNPDLPDTWNTVLKMAGKRALVAAVLNGTAASDVFTQDAEDMGGGGVAAESVFGEPEKRTFNPGTMLLEGAISGDGAAARLIEAQVALDPTLDWKAILESAATSVLGERKNWSDTQKREFKYRWSNALRQIEMEAGTGDFPPVTDEQVQAGIAFAFEGHAATLPLPRLAKQEELMEEERADAAEPQGGASDEDLAKIPFGE